MARLLISQSPSLMGRLVGLFITAALVVVGLMFSMVLLAVIATVGVLGFGYVWWKTRALRRQMRQMQQQHAAAEQTFSDVFRNETYEGEIIEGEVVRKVVSIEDARQGSKDS
ncbi:MAG: hypothetical protein PHH47_10335 [Gallionella sp.]|nr:hypothetical protein [Gallionella sp.]MDD4946499.1 hypothetical protein [Gallionella sp.]MDD5612305.1 hypothetical protein [Gallionella sp.]